MAIIKRDAYDNRKQYSSKENLKNKVIKTATSNVKVETIEKVTKSMSEKTVEGYRMLKKPY